MSYKYGFKWDWFEKTRWLSIGTGILFATSLSLILLSINQWEDWTTKSKIGMIIIIISLELLSYMTSTMVNIIRESQISIRIKK